MKTNAKLFLTLGAISGALAVMLGAFGAHGLKDILCEEMLKVYHTGVEFQFYHTFALLAIGLLASRYGSRLLTASGWLFTAGIGLFSGSLYALTLSGIRALGIITPIGGLLLLAGWVLLALTVIKAGKTRADIPPPVNPSAKKS
jgi:uncharacterized membrane protein YgdD (TMEM256/DUF423 family)